MEHRLHNGQDFQYKVYWREAQEKKQIWNSAYIKSPPFQINNTGTYTPFEIKVQALNTVGAGPSPESKIGHSGEDSRFPDCCGSVMIVSVSVGHEPVSKTPNKTKQNYILCENAVGTLSAGGFC